MDLNGRDRDRAFVAGRRRLRDLLPAARGMMKKGMSFEQASALAGGMAPYVRHDNLDSLLVYPAPRGGWHCDLVLKEVPPGVPNTMGSPVGMPFPTEREAEASAVYLLAGALTLSAQVATERIKARPPQFLVNDVSIDLVPEVLKQAAALTGGLGTPCETREQAHEAVGRALRRAFPGTPPDDVTMAHFEALSREEEARLMVALHLAALSNVFAWPPRIDEPPDPAKRERAEAAWRETGKRR